MFLMAIAVIVSVGCTADGEILDSATTSDNRAIGFNAVNERVSTRSSAVNNSSDIQDFKVWAFSTSSLTTKYMDGVKIVQVDNKCYYGEDEQLYYWPTDPNSLLKFFAISPAQENTTTKDQYGYNFWYSHTCPDEYGVGGKNVDLMVASTDQINYVNNPTQAVSLKFKHMLAQVVFKARTKSADITAKIYSIKIHNIDPSGDFLLTNAAGTLNLSNTRQNYTVGLNDGFASTQDITSSEITELSTEKPLFMIPQYVTPWTSYGNNKPTDETRTSYLEVDCELSNQGEVYHKGKLYLPFGQTSNNWEDRWQAGYKYTYTLVLSGGYDENGNVISQPSYIEFDVAQDVDSWVETSSTTI